MKKVILMLILASILSGCIGSSTVGNNMIKTQTAIGDNVPSNKIVSKQGSVIKESDWCTTGNKITVKLPSGNKEFTVVGLTTYQGVDVCQAELIYNNGKAIKYFSKDGAFDAMISNASGSGDVYSEASSNATIQKR